MDTKPIENAAAAAQTYANGSDAHPKIHAFFQGAIAVFQTLHDRLTKIEAFVNPLMQEGAALSGNAKIEALEQKVIALEAVVNKVAEGVQVGTQAVEGKPEPAPAPSA